MTLACGCAVRYPGTMKIDNDMVVGIDYTLKDDAGTILDSSEGNGPLHYLHGHGNIVEGLETALAGRGTGDSFDVTVSPEQGYGEMDEGLVFEVPKDQLPSDITPEKGMELMLSTESGGTAVVRIRKVKPGSVELDANHELAGKTLHFSVTVREVRTASGEELQHGHAHGPDGHHHH